MSRRILALVAVVWVLAACGGKRAAAPIESRAPRSRTLSLVPADTPYVFVALDAIKDTPWTPTMRDFHDAIASDAPEGTDAGSRMVQRLLAELRDGNRIRTARELGFSDDGEFVVYGLSLWPVLRLAIDDATKVRSFIGRVFAEPSPEVSKATAHGATYWTVSVRKLAVVIAVLEHELAVAILPASALPRALPLVLGHERPARTLDAAQVIEKEAARYGYLRDWFGYIDSKRVLDLLAGDGDPIEQELGALWKDASLAGCKTDFERIARAIPRIVFGYRRIDQQGVEAELLVEAPALGAELAALRTAVPSLVAGKQRPLFAMGLAANAGAVVDWVRSTADRLAAHPFTCSGLDQLDEGLGALASRLANAPAFVRTLQGAAIVVDDITLSPKTGTGTAIVVGDGIPMLVSMLWAVPPLAGTPQPAPGLPAAVPLKQLGIDDVSSAHVGVAADRLALAVGPDSGTRIHTTLAATAPRRSPLLWFALDVVRAEELGAFEGKDRTNIEKISTLSLKLDATSRGLVFGFVGTWRPNPARR